MVGSTVDSDEIVYGGVYYDGFYSSNIYGFVYEYDQKKLSVDFKSGGNYYYTGVPEDVIYAWLGAASAGSFHYHHIAYSYPYHRVK
jgi:hypothetical protein